MAPSDGRGRTGFVARLQAGMERCEVKRGARLLVALSGGADSTALLLGLRELADTGSEVEAAHFNHRLRGVQSDADEQHCKELCERLGVRLHCGQGDVAAHAAETGMSIEAAARDLRYGFLAQTVAEHGFDAVVTGHTMNDQAETVLLAITRGAGLRGLSGMAYATDRHDLPGEKTLRVLRPMLGLRRADTVEFCELNGVSPLEDASNAYVSFARNRIRHNVLPELERINRGVIEAIGRLAGVIGEDLTMIESASDRALGDGRVDDHGGISRGMLRKLEPALLNHVLAAAYRRVAGSLRDLDMVTLLAAVDAVKAGSTGTIDLPNGVTVVVEHDAVRFLAGGEDAGCPYPESVGEHLLAVPGEVEFVDGSRLIAETVTGGLLTKEARMPGRWRALISTDAVAEEGLSVRSRRDGDRFHPLGMPGEMKLQDFMVNQHLPERWRDRVPLVIGKHGICWVAGERIAAWAKVNASMSEVVLLELTFPPR